MKIALGFKIIESSWGGGNQFAKSLSKELKKRGHEITNHLSDNDIDIILLTDPRSYNEGIAFGSFEILRYILCKNKNAIVVHRINECDERKNTKHMNKFLKWANYCADHTVFVSSWLKELDIYIKNKPSSIILSGADENDFNDVKSKIWNRKEPLKIVTHHWSPNKMKGFDVYKELDKLITKNEWIGKIKFTYIGNLPRGFIFENTKVIKPMSGKSLGEELSKHHIYISGSYNEPAGMHHIEGVLAGLPIIYKNSGALPEYCKNYGACFDELEFIPALEEIISNYDKYKSNLKNYPHNATLMNKKYIELFSNLIKDRDKIIQKRKIFKSPLILFYNLIFVLIGLAKNLKKFLK